MKREEIIQNLKQKIGSGITGFFDKSAKRVYVEIKPEAVTEAVSYIFNNLKARFNTATGIDARNNFEMLYHFIVEDANVLITLRVKLPKTKPQIDSITPIFKGANWIEREINELLGIDFNGHPDMRRLLLGEEWPKGVYPLRADYKEWDKGAIRDRGI